MRVVCDKEGDTLVLFHVNAHDKAYEWAKRHRVIRVGNVVRIIDTERTSTPDSSDQKPPGPLAAIPAKWLNRLKMEAHAATFFRGIPDDDTLLEICSCCTRSTRCERRRPPVFHRRSIPRRR